MNILQVTPYFSPAWAYGGPPRIVYELSCELVRRGHSVTVLTTDALDSHGRVGRSRETLAGVEVHRFRNLSNYLAWHRQLFIPIGITSFLQRRFEGFDVVHLHTLRTLQNMIIHRFATKRRIPYVLSAHGSMLRIVRQRQLKAVFDLAGGTRLVKDASRFLAQSNVEKSEYEQAGVPSAKISVVLNGVDASAYGRLPPPGAFLRSLGLDGKSLVTYLGRLSPGKGLDSLVAAFREVASATNDCALVVAGQDDGYRRQLVTLAKQLGISDRVLFPGFVAMPEKLQLFVDSDIVVYPAPHESFGLVPMEALLCGRPVVVSRDSGCGELIESVRAGITFPSGDIVSLRDAILIGLRKDPTVSEMVHRGRNFVLRELDWARIAGKIEKAYETAASATN